MRGGDDAIETTIAHEIGHALLLISNQDQSQRLIETVIKELGLTNPHPDGTPWYREHYEQVIKLPQNSVIISRMVSNYAATNADEFIAEVWAEYTMNPNPAPHIKRMGDVFRDIIMTARYF